MDWYRDERECKECNESKPASAFHGWSMETHRCGESMQRMHSSAR